MIEVDARHIARGLVVAGAGSFATVRRVNALRIRAVVLLAISQAAWAQSYDDLATFRNPRLPYRQLLQIESGVMGSMAKEKDVATGLDDEIAFDGSVLYHDEAVADGGVDLYGGRDGFLASLRKGEPRGNDTVSRLQLSARIWPFFREGFYRDQSFVPTGQYEATDYEAYLGFGREAAEDLFVEFGPYYRRNQFNRSDLTAPTFTVPGDYASYGMRIFLEHNTVQLDRRSHAPRDGFILTAVLEREWNDSETEFGTQSWTSELPSAVFRGRGRMEWYIPSGGESAFEIFVTAAMADETDRIVNYDATRPQGDIYGDAQLRYRIALGDWMSVSPFVQGQYVQAVGEDGAGGGDEFFYGGGAEAFLHFSDIISLNAWYSYLNNESRPSVSIQDDIHGEHMFYAGMILRFGGSRR